MDASSQTSNRPAGRVTPFACADYYARDPDPMESVVSDNLPRNPYAPPQAPVEDVPDTSGTLEKAGRGARLGAGIIDGLVVAAIVLPVWLWVLGREMPKDMLTLEYVAYLGIGMGVYLLLNGRLLARNGQTIGKRLLSIRIVRSDGSAITLARAFGLRYAINTSFMFVPFVGWIYALADCLAIFGERKLCLHDRLADTMVVKA